MMQLLIFFYKEESNKIKTNFFNSKRKIGDKTRRLTASVFHRQLTNGESTSRDYLVYSKSTGSVFCASCKLFGTQKMATTCSKLASEGVSDWKNIASILSAHENSQDHMNSELALLTRKKGLGTIISHYESYVEVEKSTGETFLLECLQLLKSWQAEDAPFAVKTRNSVLCIMVST